MKLHLLALVAAALAASAALAGHVSETIALTNGWNAVYLESTPDNFAPEEFFADMPEVARVGCYESSVYGATEQINGDGTTIAQKPVSFYVWVRGDEVRSTLKRILGGRCYLIYATGPASKTFYGSPACPRVSWQAAEDGFATIVGVSIPAGETVPSAVYFREGPMSPEAIKAPYEPGGLDAAAPEFTKLMSFRGTPALKGGGVYAFEGGEVADWPGVVKVLTTTLSGTIAFEGGVARQSFSVANAGTTNRTIRVSYGPSELASEEKPPLMVFIPRVGTNEYGWTTFGTHDFDLAPGESRTLALATDKSGFTADRSFAGIVTVSDLSGTKMRVRVPVTAALDADSPRSAAFPKGLWYGNIELSQANVVMQVLDRKAFTTKYTAAVIRKDITFSDDTYHEAFNKFSSFVSANRTAEDLINNAKQNGYVVLDQKNITTSAHNVANISTTKEVLRWLFDAKVGDVSKMTQCGENDHMLIAILDKINKKGYVSLDNPQVKEAIRSMILRDKKAEMIEAKIKDVKSIAEAEKADAKISTVDQIKFSDSRGVYVESLMTPEVALAGAVAGTEQGKFSSKPVRGNAGVYLFNVNSKTKSEGENTDVKAMERQLAMQRVQMMGRGFLMQELYQNANVVDNRYTFF